MEKVQTIQEHQKINSNLYEWNDNFKEGMILDDNHKFFTYHDNCYNASYVIGAQWFDINKELPIIITPKFENIDFLKMFSVCLSENVEADCFSDIYGINFGEKPISTEVFKTAVTPLIVVQYLAIIQKLIKSGLRKDYIIREDNLKKIKGHTQIFTNERKNIMQKRFDRIYCDFQEYSINTPENKLLKKALLFSQRIVQSINTSNSYSELDISLRKCLAAFDNVNSDIEIYEIRNFKRNKLYKNYSEALKLANYILKRFDFSITKVDDIIKKETQTVPPFWIDMPLLFEHYVLGLFRRAYKDDIIYQKRGKEGYPDFLKISEKMILDTKYKDESTKAFQWDNIQQLSGYARDKKIVYDTLHATKNEIVKCVLVYPDFTPLAEQFKFNSASTIMELINQQSDNEQNSYIEFYKLLVPVPLRDLQK